MKLSNKKIEEFALAIAGEIHNYITDNQAAYILWLEKRKGIDPQAAAELLRIQATEYGEDLLCPQNN